MPSSQTIVERPSLPPTAPLVLEPVVGPTIAPIAIDPAKTTVLGRSSACQVILADESVSRRHAQVHHTSDTWFITDLGSRHGTLVNAIQLAANGAAPLNNGDLISLGPWTFRVRTGGVASNSHITTDDRLMEQERVERVQEREMAAITQNRLTLLMNCAAGIAGVSDEAKLAKTIIAAAIEGTGFPRAAVLREVKPQSNAFDIVCARGPSETKIGDQPNEPPVRYSTSLIAAARSGDLAQLKSDATMAGGASIISLGIQTAMCAPIAIGGAITAFLYLDARAGESGGARGFMAGFGALGSRGTAIQQDAAAFCMALAKMYSLAMSNILREQLAQRQATIEKELFAAREAQRLIMPPEEGIVGGIRYAMRMRSGRYVAGDLFDVIDLPDRRVAVLLGDVAGKGIGAAILMATAQTHLNASLRSHPDPAEAVAEVNRYLCTHVAQNKFISLWLGVFDPVNRSVAFVDAGHGHWLLAGGGPGARDIRRVDSIGGLPLGIEHDYVYQTEQITLEPTDRLVIFSDGVVEQPSPDGAMFNLDRAIAALEPATTETEDVAQLFDAVVRYAQTDSLSDDTTVASVAWQGNIA
jgi:sigma-B regulation protein RsbU (phosphoserine phosphatase)